MTYLSLFFISFLSATLLPLGSEGVLLYDVSQHYSIPLLWFVASLGNTLGSVVNYMLGYKGEAYLRDKKHLKSQSIDKYQKIFAKYGAWSLVLSPLPLIGDPITFIAGILKYNFKLFLLIVFFSKAFRYALLIYFLSIFE